MCKIVRNLAQCGNCHQVIESTHRHDFVTCKCGNLSVDGGLAYTRRVYGKSVPFKELSEWSFCNNAGCHYRDVERDEVSHENA